MVYTKVMNSFNCVGEHRQCVDNETVYRKRGTDRYSGRFHQTKVDRSDHYTEVTGCSPYIGERSGYIIKSNVPRINGRERYSVV